MYALDSEAFNAERGRLEKGQTLLDSLYVESKKVDYGAKVTTADCVEFIKKEIKGSGAAWKRRWKKRFDTGHSRFATYRVFESGADVVTVLHDAREGALRLYDFDLRSHMPAITAGVDDLRKHVIGIDGPTIIEYNPKTEDFFLCMSDCGWIIVDDADTFPGMTEEELEELVEESAEYGLDCLYGDEFSPEPEMGYIPVGALHDAEEYEI